MVHAPRPNVKWARHPISDRPVAHDPLITALAFVVDLVFAEVLFYPATFGSRQIISSAQDPWPDVIGTLAGDAPLGELYEQVHPTAARVMRLDVESGPFSGGQAGIGFNGRGVLQTKNP